MNATQWKKRLVAGVFACAFLPAAYAAAPAANTVIGNQASASYTDAAGNEFTATSNLVTSTVQQVYSLTLTATQSKSAAQGQFVYFPHTLTNTGNGADIFALTKADGTPGVTNLAAPKVFRDNNANGVVDVGDQEITSINLAAGEQVALIVQTQTTTNQTDSVTLTATSQGDNTKTVTNTDTVNVVTGAVIEVTKSISKTSGVAGDEYIYTLTYQNIGNAPATSVKLSDVLDSNLTYKAGTGRSNTNTTLTDAADPETNSAGVTYSVTGQTISAQVASVPAGGSGTLQFTVTVKAATPAGVINNTAKYCFNDSNCSPTTNTNTVAFQVNQAASVVAYDVGNASTGNGGDDKVLVASANQGGTVTFTDFIYNTGNGVDQFNIKIAPGTFPAGTSFQLYKSDGFTPLLDTNGDGAPDTGDVSPSTTVPYNVVVKAQLPKDFSPAPGNGPYTATLTATSVIDPTKSDTVLNELTTIKRATVDLTNGADNSAGTTQAAGLGVGAGTDSAITTKTVTPGSVVKFSLVVTNPSAADNGVADTYALSAVNEFSAPYTAFSAPGYTVAFFQDATASGAACTTLGAQVSDTGNINAGASAKFCAQVTVSASAAPATTKIYFRVVSQLTGATDIKRDDVVVGETHKIALNPDNVQQAFPGGVVVYTHTLQNLGNVAENVTVTKADSNGVFASVMYYDSNGNGVFDENDALLTAPLALTKAGTVGDSVKVFVRVSVPSNVAAGSSNVTTLTATAGTATDTAVDTTNVVSGFVQLDKKAAKDSNCDGTVDVSDASQIKPGECIIYTVMAKNNGSTTATGVRVADTVPAFTSLNGTPGCSVTGCTAVVSGNAIRTDAVNLEPGQTVVLTFRVKVAE